MKNELLSRRDFLSLALQASGLRTIHEVTRLVESDNPTSLVRFRFQPHNLIEGDVQPTTAIILGETSQSQIRLYNKTVSELEQELASAPPPSLIRLSAEAGALYTADNLSEVIRAKKQGTAVISTDAMFVYTVPGEVLQERLFDNYNNAALTTAAGIGTVAFLLLAIAFHHNSKDHTLKDEAMSIGKAFGLTSLATAGIYALEQHPSRDDFSQELNRRINEPVLEGMHFIGNVYNEGEDPYYWMIKQRNLSMALNTHYSQQQISTYPELRGAPSSSR